MEENSILKRSVGVDISKDKFDVCFVELNNRQQLKIRGTRAFDNKKKGHVDFCHWLDKYRKGHNVHITMEATGVYYESLAHHLYSQGYAVHVVLPNKAKHYLESLGLKSKNDSIDAKGLSNMGAQQQLSLWEPPTESLSMIRTLTRHLEALHEQLSVNRNQLHSCRHSMYRVTEVETQLENTIEFIQKQITDTTAKVEQLIDQDAELKSKVERISKVKGLGKMSVATVIAETNGFKLFKNQRQLVSYAGYDVVENSSGKHIGKTKISKKGNSHIRRILHLPAITAVRCNEPHLTALFNRIYNKTKIKKKGYVAVQKKLLVLIYTLWKNDQQYDPNHYKTHYSTNQEHRPLLSLTLEKISKKTGEKSSPAQDELQCNQSHFALLSLQQT